YYSQRYAQQRYERHPRARLPPRAWCETAPASPMNEELRSYGLGAAFAVLLGAGGGLGWHYLGDVGGGRAAAAVTLAAKEDAPDPGLSCPPQGGGSALDVPTGRAGVPDIQQLPRNKPQATRRASRAERVGNPGRTDGAMSSMKRP